MINNQIVTSYSQVDKSDAGNGILNTNGQSQDFLRETVPSQTSDMGKSVSVLAHSF